MYNDDVDDPRGNENGYANYRFFSTPIINCINTTTHIIYFHFYTRWFFCIAYFSIITKSNAAAYEYGFFPSYLCYTIIFFFFFSLLTPMKF